MPDKAEDRNRQLEQQSQVPQIQVVEDVNMIKMDRKMVQSNIINGFKDDKKKAGRRQSKKNLNNPFKPLKIVLDKDGENPNHMNLPDEEQTQILRLNGDQR